MEVQSLDHLQSLVSLCKQRGFIFQSSEIYGGLNSCWDYGPLGVELKNNIKKLWWESMTHRWDVVGLDSSILMHPKVWEASGHTDHFSDPLVDCRSCKARFRAEALNSPRCPKCGSEDLTPPRDFNLMFQTHMGPVAEDGNTLFLRPETAQGIFVNFENVRTSQRLKIPFGIAQIGKSFRNEITPGNFIFRTREFEQMEMQYFVAPGQGEKFFHQWKQERWKFYEDLGLDMGRFQYKDHGPSELAHYASQAGDIEYHFPMGWQELEGVHNRGDFDLTQHQNLSSKKLEYHCTRTGEKFIPHVIETSLGCDRFVLAVLCDAYREEKGPTFGDSGGRVVLGLNPKLAPVEVALLPLSKKASLQEWAQNLGQNLMKKGLRLQYDETQSIGKRYRRQDEIGTPYCLTVDFDTLTDQKVTLRKRDDMSQVRLSGDQVWSYLIEARK